MTIEDYISRELSGTDRQTALDFVRFLREKELHFHRDTCDCWKDKIYYWVQRGDDCVCFIAIADPDEPANRLTVWSDDMCLPQSEAAAVSDAVREAAWRYVDHCGHCGSCGSGRRKIIFGRTFEDVCGCTFRVDNPSPGDLPFLKEVVELRLAEIAQ